LALTIALKQKVYKGLSLVTNSDSILNLLDGSSIITYYNEIACGEESNGENGFGFKLYQFKYLETIFNIVLSYNWNYNSNSAEYDSDIILHNSLKNYNKELIFIELEKNLKSKFSSFKFFVNFNEASAYIKDLGKQHSIRITFFKNLKRTNKSIEHKFIENKKKSKVEKYENHIPTPILLNEFLPQIVN